MEIEEPLNAPPQAVASSGSVQQKMPAAKKAGSSGSGSKAKNYFYAALDLGTNNCRLLIAEPTNRGFRVVDAFSRIVRLGEGLSSTGRLSEEAIARTMAALKICQDKIKPHQNLRTRLIATEACRKAQNGPEFIRKVEKELGLRFEIINGETEAQLAVKGCSSLIDRQAEASLVFDIGGGSTELIWVDFGAQEAGQPMRKRHAHKKVVSWASLPSGVVTLSERHGGADITPQIYQNMVADVSASLADFAGAEHVDAAIAAGRPFHFLGTSGTVTTLAGVHLDLPRYDRRKVDGQWLSQVDARRITDMLVNMSYEERKLVPCIGTERADLVLAGCAILDAIWQRWPVERLRVADRGLREGMLNELMAMDGLGPLARKRRRRPRRKAAQQAKNAKATEGLMP